MMRHVFAPIAISLLLLSACATRPAPPPPAPIAYAPIPQSIPMPAGTYVGMPVPAMLPGGEYATPNVGLSSAGAIWHLRSGLNFAALACRGAQETAIVARYNAMIAAQKPVLARAEAALLAEYRISAGAQWRDAYDDAMTRLYNYYALAPARRDLCATADRLLAEAQAVPPADFADFAAARLPDLDRSFTQVFRAYEAWRDQRPQVTYAASAAMPKGGVQAPWIKVDPIVLRMP